MDRQPTTLTEIVTDLPPQLRQALSAIRIEYRGEQATATLSIAIMLDSGAAPRSIGGYDIVVDAADLPEGVALQGWSRYPDITRPITMAVPMDEQIRALGASGLVGIVDACRFDGGAEAVRAGFAPAIWHIRTHAGSDAERAEWVRGLPK